MSGLLRLAAASRGLLLRPRRMFSAAADGTGKTNANAWKDDSPLPDFDLKPKARPNEPLLTKRRRLYYESKKRGILENDILLGQFAHKHLEGLSVSELAQYDDLLDENDWDIYYWATNAREAPPQYQGRVLDLIKEIAKNKEGVILTQPNEVKIIQ